MYKTFKDYSLIVRLSDIKHIASTQKHDTSNAKWRPHFFSLLKFRHFTIRGVVALMSTDWSFIQCLWGRLEPVRSCFCFLFFLVFINYLSPQLHWREIYSLRLVREYAAARLIRLEKLWKSSMNSSGKPMNFFAGDKNRAGLRMATSQDAWTAYSVDRFSQRQPSAYERDATRPLMARGARGDLNRWRTPACLPFSRTVFRVLFRASTASGCCTVQVNRS